MSPLINKIEAFGRARDEGLISTDDAADGLAEASGGGLTKAGAKDLVSNGKWKTARAEYERVFDEVEARRAERDTP